MIQDRLMINDDKTEFLLVGTRQQLDKLDSCSITVGSNRISPSPCVKNLGSLFDSNLSMTDHINKACNAAFYHLHNLRRIKKYLSRDSLINLVHAFILRDDLFSCLDDYHGQPLGEKYVVSNCLCGRLLYGFVTDCVCYFFKEQGVN